jgi:phage tail sheath gpL-like
MAEAVGTERISRIVGYKITKGNFGQVTPNLPQRIAILAEGNHANQADMPTTPREITSAKQAGELYGYGSPIYTIMRILRPINSTGVGGIPTIVYPQLAASGATNKVIEVTPTGTATGNGTHYLRIAGRTGLDGVFYAINIVTGDGTAEISQKIEDAVNAVLGAPVTASSTEYVAALTTKWKGLTANALTVTVEVGDNDLGITYSTNATQAGAGTPSIAAALTSFGSAWNTLVINSYGTVTAAVTSLEDYNGIPDPENPTGRYAGIIMKPLIALTGSVADDDTTFTDTKKAQVTIAICPAPASPAFPFEAAANMAAVWAPIAQDSPHLDASGRYYPDMPGPSNGSIGSMASYENRDLFVKKGCSTVDFNTERYQVMDFVTTYHPDGETPPQFRYVRNLNVDFNVRYGYYLLELQNVVDHVIANDADTVTATSVVKPKMWKGVLSDYATQLAQRALIVDAPFMQESLAVNISTTNPDRFETFFRYKRSGYARIASTTAEAGFNFGTLTV